MKYKNLFPWLKYTLTLTLILLLSSCLFLSFNPKSLPKEEASTGQWRVMNNEEEHIAWQFILNSPLGIAALNQLAIEGFINPLCPKTFYINDEYAGLQTLLRVECPEPRGASIAIGYDEIRVIFNRFEDNIEDFSIERVSQETGEPKIPLDNL